MRAPGTFPSCSSPTRRRGADRASDYTPVVDEAVTEPGPTLAEPTDEGLRLVDAADAQGVVLRLVGGVAIWARCPSARRAPLARPYNDIDFVTRSGSTAAVTAFFAGQGYEPNRMFNALHGAQRLMYADRNRERTVDVLIDRFAMCHQLDLRDRLPPGARTLPLADLLLTKLQVWEINEKDLGDITCLLADHAFADSASADGDAVGLRRILSLTGDDWGLCHTLERNLGKVSTFARERHPSAPKFDPVVQAEALLEAIGAGRKSLGWQLRGRIGERMRWYEVPEEVRH